MCVCYVLHMPKATKNTQTVEHILLIITVFIFHFPNQTLCCLRVQCSNKAWGTNNIQFVQSLRFQT